MGIKLSEELQGRVLGFHPETATLQARSRLGAQAAALDVYERFLERTRSLLKRLPFRAAAASAAGRVAVIVEPRATPQIVTRTADVIRNVGSLLNSSGRCDWALQFFHGTSNVSAVAQHFSVTEWAHVSCVSLGVDNLGSSHEYSSLLTSHWFWSKVAAERVLIFQEDALLLGPSVERFVEEYGYVGAPFDPLDGWVRGKAWLAGVGGNGGLSLRRRSQAIACLDAACLQQHQFEDAFFLEALQQLGHAVAPATDARRFAVERPPMPAATAGGARTCGLHKAYNYLTCAELEAALGGLEKEYQALADEEAGASGTAATAGHGASSCRRRRFER